MVISKKCPVCSKTSGTDSLVFPKTGFGMFSDSRVMPLDGFEKISCKNCGLIFSDFSLGKPFYEREYMFNENPDEDYAFFIEGRPVSRSDVLFDLYLKNELKDLEGFSLLEIGCSRGLIMKRIKKDYPQMKLKGVDPSIQSCNAGMNNGLDIYNGTLESFATLSGDELFDAVVAIGVIEHVDDPVAFINQSRRLLKENGLLILVCPDASIFSYDIFFIDHLFHFTPLHLTKILNKAGIKVQKIDRGAFPLLNFQCVVGRVSKDKSFYKDDPITKDSFLHKTKAMESFKYCGEVFSFINENIPASSDIAIFGCSEVSSLFFAYTDLRQHKRIKFIVDERPKSDRIFDIPLLNLNELDRPLDVEMIVIATNKNYYSAITHRLKSKEFNNRLMLPFAKRIVSLKGDQKR